VARRYGGTGLGMSICKQLTELMQGSISVQSNKGEGTTVVLEIPFDTGKTEDLPVQTLVIPDAGLLKHKKILIVEDNEMNRLLVTTILEQYNAILYEAGNGREAVDALRRNTYDLVLMDMQMPVMSGLEATRIIRREISTTIPIIALTANAIKGESDKCIEAGMNGYLSKPFSEEALLQVMTEWLRDEKNASSAAHAPRQSEALYNLDKLHEIGGSNTSFVTKMITLFIEQADQSLAEMKQGVDTGNWQQVRSIAHRIKPSIDTMGMKTLGITIRQLEQLGMDAPVAAGDAAILLTTLTTEMNEAVTQLRQALDDITC
jgi:CheY-like chemotaxis protein/HPt (histidine-containing phosphotransfer) domain-containing protein